jgi:hypothetical protein
MRRINARGACLQALLFLVFGCASAGGRSIVGQWVITDVLCSDCSSRRAPEKGTSIQFDPQHIVNPLYGNCDASPGYNLLKEVSSKTLLARIGQRWPAAARREVSAQPKVLYGFVTCDGINQAQVAVLSIKRALYFYEGGLVFVLQRTTPTK